MGKAVAHGSKKSMAKQCLEDSITRKHLFELIGIKLRNEVRIMASENTGSFLQSTTTEELKSFRGHVFLRNSLNMLQHFFSFFELVPRQKSKGRTRLPLLEHVQLLF